MEEIRKRIKEARPHLSPQTVKTYGYNVQRLYKLIGSYAFEKDVEKVRTAVKPLAASIGRTLVNSAIVYVGGETPKLTELKATLDSAYLDDVRTQKKTPKDTKKWVTPSDISAVVRFVKAEVRRKGLAKKDDIGVRERELLQINLLMQFYERNPIRNEVGTAVVVPVGRYKLMKKEKKTGNYLVLSQKEARFEFFDFKTSKAFARRGLLPRVHRLTKPMFLALRQYLPHRPKVAALFVKQNGKALEGADGRDTVGRWLSKTFKRVLGKSLSSNILRKVYVSELLQDAPSLKIRLAALEKMG